MATSTHRDHVVLVNESTSTASHYSWHRSEDAAQTAARRLRRERPGQLVLVVYARGARNAEKVALRLIGKAS